MVHDLFNKQNNVLVRQLGNMLEKINAMVLEILDHTDSYIHRLGMYVGQKRVPCLYSLQKLILTTPKSLSIF